MSIVIGEPAVLCLLLLVNRQCYVLLLLVNRQCYVYQDNVGAIYNLPRVVVQSNGTWLVQVLPDQHLPDLAIQRGHLNPVPTIVSPVDLASYRINSQPVGRVEAFGDDNLVIRAVQVRSGDVIKHCVSPVHLGCEIAHKQIYSQEIAHK